MDNIHFEDSYIVRYLGGDSETITDDITGKVVNIPPCAGYLLDEEKFRISTIDSYEYAEDIWNFFRYSEKHRYRYGSKIALIRIFRFINKKN